MVKKRVISCPCGQRLQAPESAFGKQGVCPRCGQTFRIGGLAGPPALASQVHAESGNGFAGPVFRRAPSRFSQAVDLYNQRRYAEALVLLESLARELPESPEIEDARRACIGMVREAASVACAEMNAIKYAQLDDKTAKHVLLDLMLHSTNDAVRLEAVKTALALLGLPAATNEHTRINEDEFEHV